MRITYSILYDLLIVALIACTVIARRSDRPTKNSLAFLEAAVIPLIFGNLMIIQSKQYMLTMIGYYIYFLGMDLLLLALVYFTNAYCKGIGNGEHKPTVIYIVLAADAVQMIFNTLFGHAFDIEYKPEWVLEGEYATPTVRWDSSSERYIVGPFAIDYIGSTVEYKNERRLHNDYNKC